MITIINYGLGNIKAFVNVYSRLNIKTKIANTASDLIDCEKLILPGVGSFDYAMELLNASGLRDELEKQVLMNRIPIMGVCVGLQMLAKSSDEGTLPGLGWIDGHVKIFDPKNMPYKIRLPHMGWNNIFQVKKSKVLAGIDREARFYFLHSYYFSCNNSEDKISVSEYGAKFTSAINRENIYGVQFHPEKSHNNGIKLLKNFAEL
jgi:imidazole glycerol-phosphate synthase subunit HisH